MEYFEIYDEQGNPLGFQKERDQVHKDGDWHKSAHIWIVNDKNEILIHQRSLKKYVNGGKWMFFSAGGHVEGKDSSIKTAKKETFEELGINADDASFVYATQDKQSIKGKNGFISNEFVDLYFLKYNDISHLKIDENEISEYKFVSIDESKKVIEDKDPNYIVDSEVYKMLNILENDYSKIIEQK